MKFNNDTQESEKQLNVTHNISAEMAAGRLQKQAIAIALSVARRSRKKRRK